MFIVSIPPIKIIVWDLFDILLYSHYIYIYIHVHILAECVVYFTFASSSTWRIYPDSCLMWFLLVVVPIGKSKHQLDPTEKWERINTIMIVRFYMIFLVHVWGFASQQPLNRFNKFLGCEISLFTSCFQVSRFPLFCWASIFGFVWFCYIYIHIDSLFLE